MVKKSNINATLTEIPMNPHRNLTLKLSINTTRIPQLHRIKTNPKNTHITP